MYRVENYPEIKNNFFLKARNVGASRKLKGDIEIIVCFMKKKPTDFSKSTREQFSEELYVACDWLQAEAKKYGTDLTFKYRFYSIHIPESAKPENGYELIRDFFNSKNINMDQLQNRYEKMSDSNESPFILVFDEVSRSYAHKAPTQYYAGNEDSIIFKDGNKVFNWSTIAHELLHQFGAIDYYYPQKVTECAKIYIGDSIMGIGSQDVLDDLSAYLVGIKDTIACYTYHFLKETMWINAELYNKHIMDEWED